MMGNGDRRVQTLRRRISLTSQKELFCPKLWKKTHIRRVMPEKFYWLEEKELRRQNFKRRLQNSALINTEKANDHIFDQYEYNQ